MAGKGKKPTFNNRKDFTDLRVSICKICDKGIFKTQEYFFKKGIGLIHTPCDEVDST